MQTHIHANMHTDMHAYIGGERGKTEAGERQERAREHEIGRREPRGEALGARYATQREGGNEYRCGAPRFAGHLQASTCAASP